jgi:hypothetical protein
VQVRRTAIDYRDAEILMAPTCGTHVLQFLVASYHFFRLVRSIVSDAQADVR